MARRRRLGRLAYPAVALLLVLALSCRRGSSAVEELPANPAAAAAVAVTRSPEAAVGEDAGLRFRDVAAEVGLDFRYTFGDFAYDNILESSGSGATWLDADGDGDLDLYLLNGAYLEGVSDPKGRAVAGATNRLYCNDGGRFHDCTERSGLGDPTWSMAAAAADFDGDGDVDVFVANYGPNRLYRNRGDGTFEDMAAEQGLAGPAILNGFTKWSAGAAWFDADGDGDLDLAVCNFLAFDPELLVPGRPWEMPEPAAYAGQPSLLYHQEEGGQFRDVTREAGLFRPESKCMGLTVLDWDGDGRLDLFQGNDHQENFLFRARGDGTYAELGRTAGVAVNDAGVATGSMHGSPGDVDGDGGLDLLVTDLAHGSLYRRVGPLLFEDVTWASGLGRLLDGLVQWGAGLHDLDLDGDLDLFTTNGVAHLLVAQSPALAVNDGYGRFRDARPGAGPYFQGRRSGRGAAFADFDDDGDLDIAVNHVDHEARVSLLRNDTPARGLWVGFRLVGERPREAFGARVEIATGSSVLVRVHQPHTSYLSGNDPRVHFGLGRLAVVPKVTVRWPSGRVETWTGLAADRYWTLQEGLPGSR
jgi:enediyne biosynthesis protein E4